KENSTICREVSGGKGLQKARAWCSRAPQRRQLSGMEQLAELVGQARFRRPQPMPARERTLAGVFAATFLAAVVGLGAVVPHDRAARPLPLAALVLAYAVSGRVRFEIGNGDALPQQLVFIPMLFIAPLHLVPL